NAIRRRSHPLGTRTRDGGRGRSPCRGGTVRPRWLLWSEGGNRRGRNGSRGPPILLAGSANAIDVEREWGLPRLVSRGSGAGEPGRRLAGALGRHESSGGAVVGELARAALSGRLLLRRHDPVPHGLAVSGRRFREEGQRGRGRIEDRL